MDFHFACLNVQTENSLITVQTIGASAIVKCDCLEMLCLVFRLQCKTDSMSRKEFLVCSILLHPDRFRLTQQTIEFIVTSFHGLNPGYVFIRIISTPDKISRKKLFILAWYVWSLKLWHCCFSRSRLCFSFDLSLCVAVQFLFIYY